MSWSTAVILLPCLGILASALLVNRRIRFRIPISLASASIIAGASYLHAGIREACRIAESECLGATALAWIAATLWALFTIVLAARLIAFKGER